MSTKMNVSEVEINGETYVLKSSVSQQVLLSAEDYVVIRTYSAGVFAGELLERHGKEVVLENARRLWYWEGAASLSQIAVDGVSRPSNCKFPCEVPTITLTEAIEIIPCTEKAMRSIKAVPIWSE